MIETIEPSPITYDTERSYFYITEEVSALTMGKYDMDIPYTAPDKYCCSYPSYYMERGNLIGGRGSEISERDNFVFGLDLLLESFRGEGYTLFHLENWVAEVLAMHKNQVAIDVMDSYPSIFGDAALYSSWEDEIYDLNEPALTCITGTPIPQDQKILERAISGFRNSACERTRKQHA